MQHKISKKDVHRDLQPSFFLITVRSWNWNCNHSFSAKPSATETVVLNTSEQFWSATAVVCYVRLKRQYYAMQTTRPTRLVTRPLLPRSHGRGGRHEL